MMCILVMERSLFSHKTLLSLFFDSKYFYDIDTFLFHISWKLLTGNCKISEKDTVVSAGKTEA